MGQNFRNSHPGQSLAYSLLSAIVMRVAGQSELALRLPSVLAAFGTAWLLFRLGKRLLDREAALLAVVAFTVIPDIMREIPNARPYAIALFFVVASTLQLVNWMDTGKIRYMFAYAFFSAGIAYFQPLLSIIYVPHVAYAIIRVRRNLRVRWNNLAIAALLTITLLAPLLWYLLWVQQLSSKLAWSYTPNADELVMSVFPQLWGPAIFAGLLIGYMLSRNAGAKSSPDIPFEDLALIASWLLLPLVVAFLVARFTSFKIFVPRYYVEVFPALALLTGWGMRSIYPARLRVVVTAAVVGAVFVANGTWIGPRNHEDWRAAAEAVRAANIDANTPVLVHTALVETNQWIPSPESDSLLLAPLSKYPMPGRIILLPYQLNNSDGMDHMQRIASSSLEAAQHFVLVQQQNLAFAIWLQGRFGSQFVSHQLTASDNKIVVVIFDRR